MTCTEFKELVAAYALGALEAGELTACDTHLAAAAHDGCREALRAAEEAALAPALALAPVRPGDGVWKGIEAKMVTNTATMVSEKRRAGSRPRWTRSQIAVAALPWLVAAAAAILVVQLRSTVADRDRLVRKLAVVPAKVATPASEAARLLGMPGTKVMTMAPQEGGVVGHAVAIVHTGQEMAVIFAKGLAPAPNKDYQLWVIDGDVKRPAGMLAPGAEGMMVMTSGVTTATDSLALTLEPKGGMPAPTGPLVMVASLR